MQMIQVFGTWIGVAKLESLDIETSLGYVQTLENENGINAITCYAMLWIRLFCTRMYK